MTEELIPMPKHPKRRFSGEYVGIVETGEHDKFLRVQVRVKEVFTDDVPAEALPWATYRMPVGSRPNAGMFTPAAKGDYVWVDFPFNGDSRRPRITGSVHYCPGGVPNFPDEAWDGPGKCDPRRTGIEEDVPAGQARDPWPCVYKQRGVAVEILIDGTIRVTNSNGDAAGSNIEISPSGAVTVHAEQDLFLSTKRNEESAIHGDRDITTLGDITQNCQGDVTETTKGQHSITGMAGVTISSEAKVIIKAPSVEIN